MRRRWYITISLLFALSFLSLNIASSQTQSGQSGPSGMINETVKDPNGAVIAGAQVTVRNEATSATRDAVTDDRGQFKVDEPASGGYKVTVKRDGFKTAERDAKIEGGKATTAEIKLETAEIRAEIAVPTKGPITPNVDPNYRALRDGDFTETDERVCGQAPGKPQTRYDQLSSRRARL